MSKILFVWVAVFCFFIQFDLTCMSGDQEDRWKRISPVFEKRNWPPNGNRNRNGYRSIRQSKQGDKQSCIVQNKV